MHMLEMISEVLGPSLLSQVRRTEKEFVSVRKDFTTPEQTPTISLVSHPPKTEEAKTPLIRDESEQDRQLQDGERASGGWDEMRWDEASMRFWPKGTPNTQPNKHDMNFTNDTRVSLASACTNRNLQSMKTMINISYSILNWSIVSATRRILTLLLVDTKVTTRSARSGYIWAPGESNVNPVLKYLSKGKHTWRLTTRLAYILLDIPS